MNRNAITKKTVMKKTMFIGLMTSAIYVLFGLVSFSKTYAYMAIPSYLQDIAGEYNCTNSQLREQMSDEVVNVIKYVFSNCEFGEVGEMMGQLEQLAEPVERMNQLKRLTQLVTDSDAQSKQVPAVLLDDLNEALSLIAEQLHTKASSHTISCKEAFFSMLHYYETGNWTHSAHLIYESLSAACHDPLWEEGNQRYFLHISVSNEKNEAIKIKNALVSLGYTAFIDSKILESGKQVYRVRVGPYESALISRRAEDQLRSKGYDTMRILTSIAPCELNGAPVRCQTDQ